MTALSTRTIPSPLSFGSIAQSITAFFADPRHSTPRHTARQPLAIPTPDTSALSPHPSEFRDIIDYLHFKHGTTRPHTISPRQQSAIFWQYIQDCIDTGLLSWELLTDCPSQLAEGNLWLSIERVEALLEEQHLRYANDRHQLFEDFKHHPAFSHRAYITSETSITHLGDGECRIAFCFDFHLLKNAVNCRTDLENQGG